MRKIIVPIMACALLLSSCGGGESIYSSFREVEHLQIVQTLGIDSAGDGLRLSVSCSKPSSDSGGIISREGSGMLGALRSLQNYAGEQELYYAHARYLLLGEDYAREKAAEALDFVARDTQLRLGVSLFAVRGEASELITGPGDEKSDISRSLSGIERGSRESGLSRVFTCRETIRALAENGAALVCALSPAKTEGSVFLSEGGITAVPAGYGILRGDGLVGWIDPPLSQAAGFIMGELGAAGPTLPDGRGGSYSFEYSGGEVKVSDMGGGKLRLEAKLTATLAEPDTDTRHITDSALLADMEKSLAEDMKAKMEAVLAMSRELEADFLGLGAYLREKPEDWPASAEFELECKAKIDYSRELADKMGTGGGA